MTTDLFFFVVAFLLTAWFFVMILAGPSPLQRWRQWREERRQNNNPKDYS